MRHNSPKNTSWRYNAIACEHISPDRDFLIEQLAMLATPHTECELIIKHAGRIQFAVNLLYMQRQHAIRRRRLHVGIPGGHHAPGPAGA
jgi:hypothetical protein